MNKYLIFIMQSTDSKNIKLAHMAKQNEVPDKLIKKCSYNFCFFDQQIDFMSVK